MATDFAEVALALAKRLFHLASQDAEIKGQLRRLAKGFSELLEDQPTEQGPISQGPITQGPSQVDATPTAVQGAAEMQPPQEKTTEEPFYDRPSEPLPELTLGRSVSEDSKPTVVYATSRHQGDGEELGLIETRARLKAEGARWAASRRRRMADGASYYTDIEPMNRDLIARAKELPNCFLWMCHPVGPNPADLRLYDQLAGCFEALAESVSLVRQIEDEPESEQIDFEAALDLMAEAQSALRIAVEEIDWQEDHDQNAAFFWLRATATRTQIFIRNYMRLDHPADPSRWNDLLARIEAIASRIGDAKRRVSQRKRLMGKVRHKVSLIVGNPEQSEEEWRLLIAAVCDLIGGGLAPSNRELRETLLPLIDFLPEKEKIPKDFARVLEEIDRYLAATPPPESATFVKQTPEVVEAAELLEGKSLVLIGGEKRPAAYEAIKSAFRLKELYWLESQSQGARAHGSIDSFVPYVAREDVVAVLLAIRWSSHSFGDVKIFCDTYAKPLVRLPSGYNPNQVAVQVLSQASERLRWTRIASSL